MTRSLLLALLCCGLAAADDPVRTAWIMSPSGSVTLLKSLPEVHSVSATEHSVLVRSAGISMKYFGPLQASPVPAESLREFVFEIPTHPEPEAGRHPRVPVDVIGVFVNGLPIYNHFEALSWNGANLWHYDTVAYPAAPGLIEQLARNGSTHSPLIGFALDGYPVYGPCGLRRMRSSYRFRSITRRHELPDGTKLMPEQYGPDVSPSDPLGTFAEDYEYVPGSGDLDEFNGRFTKTSDYPQGTYAYFLTTDSEAKLAYPYLIGPRFYGRLPATSVRATVKRALLPAVSRLVSTRLELSTSTPQIEAGHPIRFRLEARDASGDPIRHFEYVHEKPIHLLIASTDLAEFDHIHPELAPDDSYAVTHTFAHGGSYRIWADYSLPGDAPRIDEFDVTVTGTPRAPQKLTASNQTQTVRSLTVTLTPSKPLRAGDDIPIALNLSGSTEKLEPYLGAWAHVIVIGADLQSFAHAHPIEPATTNLVHTHVVSGPPPDQIHVVTNFPRAGLYKLWAQFLSAGQVITVPFVLQVAPAATRSKPATLVPPGAVQIRVTQHGYDPASIEIPVNTPMTLALTRESSPNCGSEVVFPSLAIRKPLPVGETVLVELPAQPAGEIGFSCGMGMFRGMIVAR